MIRRKENMVEIERGGLRWQLFHPTFELRKWTLFIGADCALRLNAGEDKIYHGKPAFGDRVFRYWAAGFLILGFGIGVDNAPELTRWTAAMRRAEQDWTANRP